MGLQALRASVQEVVAVQEDVPLADNLNTEKSKWISKDKPKNFTFSTFADDNTDKKTGQDFERR